MTASRSQPSTDDLVRRLRQFQADEPGFPPLFSRAATEIESLSAQLASARQDAKNFCETMCDTNDRLIAAQDQLASARKALEWYAEPKSYSDDYWKGMWETARAAIKDISK